MFFLAYLWILIFIFQNPLCFFSLSVNFVSGTLADDTIRRIRNLQTGNLDDIIKIHEDLCTVVINTVWSHSFWFIIHWFTYGLGVVLTVIYVCDEFHLRNEYNTPVTNLAYIVLLLICHLYIFLFPCICAARITSACTGKRFKGVTFERNWCYVSGKLTKTLV